MKKAHFELLKLLVERLERLNVDSRWARRASGVRGEILKVMNETEMNNSIPSENIDNLIQKSFEILSKAAGEIPDLDDLRRKYQ